MHGAGGEQGSTAVDVRGAGEDETAAGHQSGEGEEGRRHRSKTTAARKDTQTQCLPMSRTLAI